MKPRHTVPLLVLLVASGCGTTRHAPGEGLLQKRRHQPGWHVDLGLRPRNGGSPRTTAIPQLETRKYTPAISAVAPTTARMVDHGPEVLAMRPGRSANLYIPARPLTGVQATRTVPAPHPLPPSSDTPRPRWNPWAVPAFVVAMGTVACAILGTSELLVVLAVLTTLVLASVAVRKGRTYEWRGKGFAIAALMIGALAGLITLIALLNA